MAKGTGGYSPSRLLKRPANTPVWHNPVYRDKGGEDEDRWDHETDGRQDPPPPGTAASESVAESWTRILGRRSGLIG
jgi:hypothetical protein